MPGEGCVYLVGAGPGDPGLMTRRALELIVRADVVLYDRLIPRGALAGAAADTELRYVGKEPGRPSMSQEDINAVLVELGRSGKAVVRLKGGDPFVFGRGSEEAEALAAAGVAFEVVPGVTSGIAAPAYAGIPVTERSRASAVAFVTGHEDPDKDESAIDWPALAAFPGTLVLYMGVRRLGAIADALIAAGRDGGEPVAVVERGTMPTQRTVSATLAEIAARVEQAGLRPPAITVIGGVTELREQLAWFEQRPLHGISVAVTRAREQASELTSRLADLGAEVIEAPAIRIVPRGGREIDETARRIHDYRLVCFTSANAANLMLDALERNQRDVRALRGVTVAAVGPGTARALSRRGIRADVVAERSVGEGLLEALAGVRVAGERVLVPRAADARDVVPDTLREQGAKVDVVALYDTVAERLSEEQLEAVERVDYITFTASSTVRFFVEAANAGREERGHVPEGPPEPFPSDARVVSIGPMTSETARKYGLRVHVEASRHDIDGIVEALVADAAR